MPEIIGSKATIAIYPNAEAIVTGFGGSPFGGKMLEVEINEPLPYIGKENPRRKILVHESWVTLEKTDA